LGLPSGNCDAERIRTRNRTFFDARKTIFEAKISLTTLGCKGNEETGVVDGECEALPTFRTEKAPSRTRDSPCEDTVERNLYTIDLTNDQK